MGQGDHVNVLAVAKFLSFFCAPGMEEEIWWVSMLDVL